MKYLSNFFVFALGTSLLISGCQSGNTSEESEGSTDEMMSEGITVSLEKIWETDTLLETPESVIYDEANDILYVSCINGVPPTSKDSDGYIAKVSTDGSIIEQKWITDIHAPKGMGIVNGTLYATNIDELVEIDIATGKITNRYPVEGAQFLNDLTVDSDGNVYFSDSNTSRVHKFSNGKITLWAETARGSNGLFHDGDRMMVLAFGAGTFNEIDTTSRETKAVVDSIPGGDGIVKVGGDFILSNYNGEIFYVNSAYEKKKILDTKSIGENSADIEFLQSSNTLLVPTFFANKVVAYKLTK